MAFDSSAHTLTVGITALARFSGHIISALKAPDWYVTVAVSDSSPLKRVGGRKGEGLIHLIRTLLGT